MKTEICVRPFIKRTHIETGISKNFDFLEIEKGKEAETVERLNIQFGKHFKFEAVR